MDYEKKFKNEFQTLSETLISSICLKLMHEKIQYEIDFGSIDYKKGYEVYDAMKTSLYSNDYIFMEFYKSLQELMQSYFEQQKFRCDNGISKGVIH